MDSFCKKNFLFIFLSFLFLNDDLPSFVKFFCLFVDNQYYKWLSSSSSSMDRSIDFWFIFFFFTHYCHLFVVLINQSIQENEKKNSSSSSEVRGLFGSKKKKCSDFNQIKFVKHFFSSSLNGEAIACLTRDQIKKNLKMEIS